LCNNYLFYNGVLSSSKQFRIYYVLAVVRSRFDIINRSQYYSQICQDVR